LGQSKLHETCAIIFSQRAALSTVTSQLSIWLAGKNIKLCYFSEITEFKYIQLLYRSFLLALISASLWWLCRENQSADRLSTKHLETSPTIVTFIDTSHDLPEAYFTVGCYLGDLYLRLSLTSLELWRHRHWKRVNWQIKSQSLTAQIYMGFGYSRLQEWMSIEQWDTYTTILIPEFEYKVK